MRTARPGMGASGARELEQAWEGRSSSTSLLDPSNALRATARQRLDMLLGLDAEDAGRLLVFWRRECCARCGIDLAASYYFRPGCAAGPIAQSGAPWECCDQLDVCAGVVRGARLCDLAPMLLGEGGVA